MARESIGYLGEHWIFRIKLLALDHHPFLRVREHLVPAAHLLYNIKFANITTHLRRTWDAHMHREHCQTPPDATPTPQTPEPKKATSTCQRHDLSRYYATIGLGIHQKLKHEMIADLIDIPDWRKVLCWKYPCVVYGPGGFAYASIFDAMKAEKMRFMVDQLEIHTFLEFLRHEHTQDYPRDVVTVSDDNFLSQNNLTLNHGIWDVVRRKILYGYIRQRIRVDDRFRRVLMVVFDRGITPVLFYPHSTSETYYYGKIQRGSVDTTYQKSTLRKRKAVELEVLRREVTELERGQSIVGRNMYGVLLLEAMRHHKMHSMGQMLNLRVSRKLRTTRSPVIVPFYSSAITHELIQMHNTAPGEFDEIVDELLADSCAEGTKKQKQWTPDMISPTSRPSLEPTSNLRVSSPPSTSSTIASSDFTI